MIGSRIALLALACLSPVMAVDELDQAIVSKLAPAQLDCYKAAANLHAATTDETRKSAQKTLDEVRKEKAGKDTCEAAAKIVEAEIKTFKDNEANKSKTEDITRAEKIMALMKGGSSSMLLIIIIIAAVLIVGGVLVYCFCCRSSSSASDDDL